MNPGTTPYQPELLTAKEDARTASVLLERTTTALAAVLAITAKCDRVAQETIPANPTLAGALLRYGKKVREAITESMEGTTTNESSTPRTSER